MIQPAFEILNQRGTPMFFSDVFANRPTAGVVGRIFISTDTYAFYRDTGTGWDLIGGPGTGTITGSGTANKITKFTGTTSIGDSIMTEGTGLITLTGSNSRFVVGGTDDGSSQLQTYYDGNTRWKFVAASNTPTDDADITGYKSRGTIAFPTAIQSGDSITNYSGRGHNGTTFVGGGGFDIFAAENYSVGNNGSYIAVETTPIGSASPTYFHRFSANGGLNVGQNADPTTGYVFQASGNSIVQSGKLVINNASSDSHLQVVGANAPSIRIDNAIVGATQRFVMGLATATNNFIQGSTAGDICISTASASPLLFGMWQTINASEVMRISTANNLIVGSTTDNGQKLQVNGSCLITGTALFSSNVGIGVSPLTIANYKVLNIQGNSTSNGGLIQIQNSDNSCQAYWFNTATNSTLKTVTNSELILGANNTDYFYIKPNGNIGINTITPVRLFTIFGGSNTSRIILQNTATGQAINNGLDITMDGTNAIFWNYQNGYTAFATNNIEAARISSAQNFIIGSITDIGQKFQTLGSGLFYTNNTTGSTILLTLSRNTGGYGQTQFQQSYDSTFFANGKTLTFLNDSNTAFAHFAGNNAGTQTNFILPSGNVLINTTSNPGEKLYLNGSFRIDGQRSATAGGTSGQHLIINCDGTTYKIALLNN